MTPELEKLTVEILAYFATGTVAQEFAQAVAVVSGAVVHSEIESFNELVSSNVDPSISASRWVAASGDRFYRMTQITESIVQGTLSSGETLEDVASRIERAYAYMGSSRASQIARTEVNSASNYSAFTVYDDAGFPYKGWVAIMDDKTRDSHASTHGQIRPMAEAFDVNGIAMMFPGDPTAPVKEVVNCRCALIPEASLRSMWDSKRVDMVWMSYLRRSSEWENKMKTTVTSQFEKQYSHIKSILRKYGN